MISRRDRQSLAAGRKEGVSSMMPPKEGAGRLARQAMVAVPKNVVTQYEKQHEGNVQFAAYMDLAEKKKRLNSFLTGLYRQAGQHEGAVARIQEFLNSPAPKDHKAIGLLTELLALLKNGLSLEGYAARLRGIRTRVEQLNHAMLCLALDASTSSPDH